MYLRPLEEEGHTFVVLWSPTNLGVRVDGELTRFLVTENRKLTFGKFNLNEEASVVQLRHGLLGDFLNRGELEAAVNAVADTADEYDDRIKTQFGGRLFGELSDVSFQPQAVVDGTTPPEPLPAPPRPARADPGPQAVFGFLALAAALGGAIYAYSLESSISLSLFVAVLALYLTGRAIPDLITDPQKVRRAFYFLLFPASATGLLVASHVLWHTWWLSTVIGLVGGLIVHGALAPRLFPDVHAEEMLDSEKRLAHQA